MKQKWRLILTTLILSSGCLSADIELSSDIGSESIHSLEKNIQSGRGPFSLEVTYDAIGRSKIRKKHFRHQHISFAEGQAQLGIIYYYNPEYKEGLSAAVGYTYTDLDWRHNPAFDQEQFHTYNVTLEGFSKRLGRWLWIGQVKFNMDADHLDFSEYFRWGGLLWGRYDYCPNIGVHAGLLFTTGMKIDHVYPIIGFDWCFRENWKLNLVFPVNISLIYTIDECWSVALAARIFDSIHRAGKHEDLSRALFEYRNGGIEAAVEYDCDSWLKVNGHIGATTGGKLRISNRHNKHVHHYKFNSAGYVGGELEYRF